MSAFWIFVFCFLFALAATDIVRSLDCIAGEKLACEKVHKRYGESPPAQPVEEK